MDNIEFFNLFKDGDSAVVKLLYTSVDNIEITNVHWLNVADKKKIVKCCGENCPMCAKNEMLSSRAFIHLYDYTDHKEKVWSRTDKIIPKFKEIEANWGNISNCVLKITRVGNEFPKYNVDIMPANNYIANIDPKSIDEKVAYRFYMTRSIDELNRFYSTGIMPGHVSTYVSKDEYYKSKQTQAEMPANNQYNQQPMQQAQFTQPATQIPTSGAPAMTSTNNFNYNNNQIEEDPFFSNFSPIF